jgi:hypothetical protein
MRNIPQYDALREALVAAVQTKSEQCDYPAFAFLVKQILYEE